MYDTATTPTDCAASIIDGKNTLLFVEDTYGCKKNTLLQ